MWQYRLALCDFCTEGYVEKSPSAMKHEPAVMRMFEILKINEFFHRQVSPQIVFPVMEIYVSLREINK